MALSASHSRPDPALGSVLRRLRQQQGRSQERVAGGAGITMNALGRIERGDTDPKWSTVSEIARELGTTVAEVAALVERERPRRDR
ncbi:MAG TPA: helix-turn-helix transcriptional regulator [Solirubrobacteraceae bacterium]|nr:helix-turn-helix transcriptional regulator [Solirubrobacteraceae bacterium]